MVHRFILYHVITLMFPLLFPVVIDWLAEPQRQRTGGNEAFRKIEIISFLMERQKDTASLYFVSTRFVASFDFVSFLQFLIQCCPI